MAVKQQTVSNDLNVEGLITAQGINSPELAAMKTDVAVAQTQAAMAQGTAAAITAAMADDGIITPEEKKVLLREYRAIEAEYPTIVANAQGAGILEDNPLRILYAEAYTDLTGELGDILSTMSASTPVYRDAFMALVDAYTGARAALVQGTNTALTDGITKATLTLALETQTITRSRAGSMTPANLIARAMHQDEAPYLGRFVVALSHDNQTYQDAYTSSTDESQISYPVPATMMVEAEERYVTSIRVRLYAAGGTDTLLGERMASISLGAVAPVYWGPFADAASWPTGGLLAGDYLLDTREPASGGGLLRTWNGTSWVEYTGSMAGHPQAMAMAMTDLMVWAKLYGVTTIAAVNAIFQSVAASQAFIETLATVNVKILGTVRTGPNASESARVAIQDEVGVSSVTFGGTGNNDLSVTKSGEEAGTFAVKITKDVNRYPVGSTGPAGGKVFYTDPADGYVLEAMPSDQASGVWGASVVSGASGTAVKTGEANTDVATSGDAWQEYGSPKDIAGANVPALAVLSSSAVAHIDSAQKSLTYYRKVFYWEAYGTSVPISGLGTYPAMCPLLGGVAIVDTGTLKLRYYEWGNDTWNPIGAGLTVPAGIKKVTALNSTDIALYDEGNRTLRVYRCNGSDGSWVQIGNALTFTGSPGGVSIAALNSTTVAFASGEATTGGLRRLSWDGTNFAQIGSTMPLTYALSHTSLVKLNDDEVGHMVSSLQTYRWTGSQYEAVGNVQPLSDADFSVMGHLSANDMIIVGRNSIAPTKNVLRTYRWYGPRAARTAADLSYGGYSDWFLPSKDELALMRTNRVAIGGFGTGDYWSSSETGAGTAWAQNFDDGSQVSVAKIITKAVRAIRKFYIKDHFQWNKDGGAWSAEQEITAGAQYDLGATSGIKIAFGGHVGHVLNAQWTLIQGSMYGLSIKDSAGSEYVKASNGELLVKALRNMNGGGLFSTPPPIGSTYMQLPGKSAPDTLWPGTTWSNISSQFAGDFFRAEGGNALAFGGGQQAQQIINHAHNQVRSIASRAGYDSGIDWWSARSSANDADYYVNPIGTPTTDHGTETRPVNRTVRLWERTA